MYVPPRSLVWLVALFAIRRPLDLLVKPLLFIMLIFAASATSDLVTFGADRRPIHLMFILSTASALPFLVLVFTVVTALDRALAEVGRLATTDALTGVANRGAFFGLAAARARTCTGGVVLLIDADHFKRINDTYGHPTGDECLRAIARRLQAVVRKSDVIGRLGGEEFAVFLADATMEEARAIGARLVERIRVATEAQRFPVEFTLSIGAAEVTPDRGIAFHLGRADLALYQAKAGGRARMEVFDPALPQAA